MDISKLTHADRSEVLVQALPYIQQYHGKTVVIKYGGNAMINEDLQDAVMTDIVLLRSVGINVVLVHGGGPEINHMLERVGKELADIRQRIVRLLRTERIVLEVRQHHFGLYIRPIVRCQDWWPRLCYCI